MSETNTLGLGLIGCGAFGAFCFEAFKKLDGIEPTAVADVVGEPADRLGKQFDVPAHHDPAELIARDDVNIVHVATPPSTHRELAVAAAKAGKHVLCEKPLATSVADGDAILAAAAKAGTVAPVNFVLRYNLVTDAVKAVIDSGVLGKVLGARLTNCAADSNLSPKHWFWNRELSGGIFIEHGTHFFDLYRYWLGPGEVIDAHTETRERTDQQDRMMCTVRHDSGAVASHYHGFDQIAPMDRTDHRLVCELGDIRIDGWIPLSMTIDAALDNKGADKLAEILPGGNLQTLEALRGLSILGRGQRRKIERKIRLTYEPWADKQAVYADSVRDLLTDQIAFIRDPSHPRRIAEDNGRLSLADACRATELAV